MDDQRRTQLATLKHRQARARRVPAVLEAWRSRGVQATVLNDERSEHLVGWLRTIWRQADQQIADLETHLRLATEGLDAVVVIDFWNWDEAVAVLVPVGGLLRIARRMREVCPNGFALVDQSVSKALLVDFDEHAKGAVVAQISGADE